MLANELQQRAINLLRIRPAQIMLSTLDRNDMGIGAVGEQLDLLVRSLDAKDGVGLALQPQDGALDVGQALEQAVALEQVDGGLAQALAAGVAAVVLLEEADPLRARLLRALLAEAVVHQRAAELLLQLPRRRHGLGEGLDHRRHHAARVPAPRLDQPLAFVVHGCAQNDEAGYL